MQLTNKRYEKYFLFFMFLLYGHGFQFAGNLRYVELALCLYIAPSFLKNIRFFDKREARLIYLLIAASIFHVITDIVNYSDLTVTIKRAGSYFLLAMVYSAITKLAHKDFSRIASITTGYCISYVVIVYIGSGYTDYYSQSPWRLGLGQAMTLLLCVIISSLPSYRPKIAFISFVTISAVHMYLGSRSLSIISFIVGCTCLFININGSINPRIVSRNQILVFSASALFVALFAYFAVVEITNLSIFPTELQVKMDRQINSQYGIFAAGRPEVVAAMYAITKSPILGFGSTGYDIEVMAFYADLVIASLSSGVSSAEDFLKINREYESNGIPSHSHLFGAWADAGIMVAIVWLYVLYLAIKVVISSVYFLDKRSCLFVYVGLTTIWDVLFSPGPHRMAMAINLVVLSYALGLLMDSKKYMPVGLVRGMVKNLHAN